MLRRGKLAWLGYCGAFYWIPSFHTQHQSDVHSNYSLTTLIYIDPRIGSKDLLKPLSDPPHNIRAELEPLECGDLMFAGYGPRGAALIGVEVKRLQDAVQCMQDGRLAGRDGQLDRMVRTYNHNFIVFQGMFRIDDASGVMTEYRNGAYLPLMIAGRRFMGRDWENWITQLEMNYGCMVKYTGSTRGTVRTVANLYKHLQQPWDQHSTAQMIYCPPPPGEIFLGRTPHIVERVAAQFDGIGWKRSTWVAKRFESVRRLCGSTVGEWLNPKIDGIGKVTAEKVVNQLEDMYK